MSAGAPATILIVDDEAANRKLLDGILSAEGYRTLEAASGESALDIVLKDRPDLILLDVMMPGIGGIETARRIKAHADLRAIPTVIVTSLDDEKTRLKALQAGAEDFLTRPVNRLELSNRVRNLIRMKRLGDELRRHNDNLEDLVREKSAALVQSEQLMRQTLAATPAFIMRVDRTGRIEFINQVLEGLNRDEVVGSSAIEYLPEEERPMLRRALAKVFDSNQPAEFPHSATGPGGELRHYVTRAAPFVVDGQVDSAILIATDVTEQQHLEEQLRQSQKLEAVGKLAGGVAHDFNNLLTAIISFAGFVRDDLPRGDHRRDDIDEVLSAADRAAGLTRQLLLFSRQQPLTLRPTDVNDSMEALRNLLGRTIGEDVELELPASPERPVVLIDPTQFDQLILNLAVNARDAMPDGGRLSISTRVRELTSDPSPDGLPAGSYVEIRVEDDGLGMDEEVQRHIFEPFFTTKDTEGTGLGLATCYGIVKQLAGSIGVESTPGQGAAFTVRLPLSDECPPAEAPGDARPTSLDGTETVLLVEDEKAIRHVAHRVLSERGYRVLAAEDAEQGRELFDAHEDEIDVLFSDVVLPRGNGFDLAEHVHGRRPDVAILMTSGYNDRRVTRDGDPRFPIFWKPYTPGELVRRIRSRIEEIQHTA